MSLFDKNISEDKKASLELAEQSREAEWKYPSFALHLFHGDVHWPLIYPFPEQSQEEKKYGDEFLRKLEEFLRKNLDPNEVDKTGVIPESVIKGLANLGAFAIKIPKEYGGLGLSQVNYNRAMHLVASYCGSTTVLLSAHQSIGVPQPLKLFGTTEQKNKYLPMFAKGVISAFALTETEAGSDPRNMKTTATPIEDGKYYLINGEKLWCTNGLIAGVIVVMAVTPPKVIKEKEVKQITAFIVETNTPGFEIVHRCQFMGLHGIQNGIIRFNNVKVPKENIILGEGEGLKLALTTLNTGRLTIPAASVGISKWCLYVSRVWAKARKQWGASIGEHETISLKLAYIASHTFAMEAATWLTSFMADDKKKDIRLEAAMAKHFCTNHSWQIVNETLQIRGGQGYETEDSLKARGMESWPIERALRDIRINLIIEGTTEIMHLFIAREALDPHLGRLKILLGSSNLLKKFKTILYYLGWYPTLWGVKTPNFHNLHPKLQPLAIYIKRASQRLAREIFHQMLRYQKKLEAKQAILNRIVDIGTELFVMAAACSYADSLTRQENKENALELATLYSHAAKNRVELLFKENHSNQDSQGRRISQKILAKEFEWLENEIIK